MATQFTGGLTVGEVLTSAEMNSIGAAWETWTPTISSTIGTITSGTVTLARYARIQKLVFVNMNYTITTAGTANGGILVTSLPIAPLATYPNGQYLGGGREYAISGLSVQCHFITPDCRIITYLPGTTVSSGSAYSISLCYEAA